MKVLYHIRSYLVEKLLIFQCGKRSWDHNLANNLSCLTASSKIWKNTLANDGLLRNARALDVDIQNMIKPFKRLYKYKFCSAFSVL